MELSTQLIKSTETFLQNHGEETIKVAITEMVATSEKIKSSETLCIIAQCLKVQRLAKKSVISDDDFRSPNVEMLLGNDVWVTRKENNIHYTWNITKSMFSVGNITEKQRISKFDCQGKVIGNFCLFV